MAWEFGANIYTMAFLCVYLVIITVLRQEEDLYVEAGWGWGARNMNSIQLPLAAFCFLLISQERGRVPLLPSPNGLLEVL